MLRSWFNIIALLVTGTLTGVLLFFLWRISDGTELHRVERDAIQFQPLPETPPSQPDTTAPEPSQAQDDNETPQTATPPPEPAAGESEKEQPDSE